MNNYFGYQGVILRVNLSDGKISKEPLNLEDGVKFIGGRGLGTKILFDEVDPKIDPLSIDNKVIFATGPLSGTATPTGGRYMVITKSPLTGTVASSNSGGFWGAELKLAGYDAVIIEGKSEKPVYLNIADDVVTLEDASGIWGNLVDETTTKLENIHGEKARIATIGPAGEKLSKISGVMNERGRAAGRSGVGAVLGSKNFKAIVVRGTNKVNIKEPDKLKGAFSNSMTKIRENGVTGQGLPAYGTAVLVNIINEHGALPTNNFQESHFDLAEAISGETLAEKYLKKKDPCYRCPIGCGRYCEADYAKGAGPEYETIWGYGSNCGVSDLGAIIKANYWCNEYGLDTISAATTIAAAMELYQKGYIKKEDLDGGPELVWGNADAIIEWTKRMGEGNGLGALMAEGSYRLCENFGVSELSMSVKKQEMPAYDPRGIQGIGLNYATSNRGGCHVRGYMISPEILGLPQPLDRFATEGKAEWTKIFQDFTAAIDSVGLCLFTSFALGADDYADLYNAVCGTTLSGNDFIEHGERVWNLERLFNLKAGIDPSQDTLPKRLLEDPISSGPSKGWLSKLSETLPLYYKERGWTENGLPTDEKLESLGIKEYK
ncbi:aldehyde ferredoxin oxidoreductase family protein [Sedimentibacter hydroxybenzoicus DSM 7310]|uniref:Aldehyde ferredoxin oxidoreductase family protein n=1 Tax=Sedimentibacter hydroxybenzoicus DSM 7310 TaxID=1123245 RepID=A0A974BMN6_SEDHY|nr:aldehyde ferredoxin oxidoreductase family protein [Sedimentibacter hydroxybenzoicus]NYB76054.1 aldehyde ferredoxin oxidoreductase family protein [Sedimentibacter hydroxybenzoicus DSM 7310]